MLLKRKNRIKPLYKKFIYLRDNVQNRTKLLKFKRKKWASFIRHYLKNLKRFNKFKSKDQSNYVVTKYSNKNTSYKKQFKQNLVARSKFKLFYGGLLNKYLKKNVNYALEKNKKQNNINKEFLKLHEKRLDTILVRSKFSKSFRDSRQLISHGKILVNNYVIKSPSYALKPGDLISINHKFIKLFENNLRYCIKTRIKHYTGLWPLPPKHLIINYRTMEIFICKMEVTNFETEFTFNLNLEKILTNRFG